ncbi:oxidoreductase [Methylobacterium sp. Leaf399]|uniref:SDR family NAD(P)-dependent oxidoreductase n=1 Tax=Methylobacterium sp. Leaf399 TaxID=1736364 RepID=UPI0006F9E3D3|nr:SDR family NAD(P)-dependent oxidoreductase [Methylobacterium sp. Leaf399]KQT13431.1 oxidoreductase [Methylobacterium sp. Leaf399]
MTSTILSAGRVAVVTGAAAGIGAAAARRFASEGMRLCLFDRDGDALAAHAATLDADVRTVVGDVADPDDLRRFHGTAYEAYGAVDLLMNNAGITAGAGPWGDPSAWRRQLDVNFGGVLTAQHLFVPTMLAADRPAAIVNLGSKEGITTPPGNAAYAVAKAGVRVLTEQLAHELRQASAGRVTAHLLVPGFTWTPMNAAGRPPEKPPSAWTADQVVERFAERFSAGDFYILCPDNEVTHEVDALRIRWSADDMIENRPALSRWHPDWKDRFERWMEAGSAH